jgi:hypothetical protein
MSQGTTSVVPKRLNKHESGHDFSRAEKARKTSWALAPEGRSCWRRRERVGSRYSLFLTLSVIALKSNVYDRS